MNSESRTDSCAVPAPRARSSVRCAPTIVAALAALWTAVTTPLVAGASPPVDAGGSISEKPSPPPPREDGSTCGLFDAGADGETAAECVSCHGRSERAPGMHMTHPVGHDYAVAQTRKPDHLRPLAEVARRKVRLPNGRVECVTCHSAVSPWASRIALPEGAVAIAQGKSKNWRLADPRDPPPPQGSVVSAAPLCAACHTMGD